MLKAFTATCTTASLPPDRQADMKAAFLDRDGTIVRDYPDKLCAGQTKPDFLPGSLAGLAVLQSRGYELIVVTNQYLIGEGVITQRAYDAFTKKMLDVMTTHGVEIRDILYCPHARWENCRCAKPAPGMIEQALLKYPWIDLSVSFYVGDAPADRELAAHFHLPFFQIIEEDSAAGWKRVVAANQ